MPISTHINFLETADFTAGLWDVETPNELLGPQQAFSKLVDYEPQKGGGLRAFYQGAAVVTTGMVAPTTEVVSGIYVRGDASGSDPTNQNDQYLATINTATSKAHVYRLDLSDGDTAWEAIHNDAAGAGSNSCEASEFCQFTDDSGNVHVVWTLRTGSEQGLYQQLVADESVSKLQTWHGAGPCVSAGRLLVSDSDANIIYSDLGHLTWVSTTLQKTPIDRAAPGGRISMISNRAPSDVLVGLQGAPWYEINGDISNATTPIRQMSGDHFQRAHFQQAIGVPGGKVAFIEPGGCVYITDGNNFENISQNIVRFVHDIGSALGAGQLAYADDYIFAPGGHVYDMRTKAWFTSSFMPTSAWHMAASSGRVYMANADISAILGYIKLFEGGDSAVKRCVSGVAQTVPYADAKGRNVRIRDVELFVKNYSATSVSVSIIDSNDNVVSTDTVSASPTGRTKMLFLFPNVEDRYLSVRVSTSSDNGTSETCTLERLRIGFGQNNIIGNAAQ